MTATLPQSRATLKPDSLGWPPRECGAHEGAARERLQIPIRRKKMHRMTMPRPFRRAAVAAAILAASVLAPQAAAQTLPSYYPKSYSAIVEGSKKENKLVVYSIMAEYNWKPVLEG